MLMCGWQKVNASLEKERKTGYIIELSRWRVEVLSQSPDNKSTIKGWSQYCTLSVKQYEVSISNLKTHMKTFKLILMKVLTTTENKLAFPFEMT